MNGLKRIAEAFARARGEGNGQNHRRAALIPYYTLGYPDRDKSMEIIQAISQAGADLIELGIPFSDPLADGPTIQRSTQAALEAGMSVPGCLEIARLLRLRGVQQPLLFMGYYNPILAYGVERFVNEAAKAGMDGLIVPDVPPEEAGRLKSACHEASLALVFLAAPTSTPERIAAIAKDTTGFLYLVSLTGVTGARQVLPDELEDFIQRARQAALTPVAVGFGIATPEQARRIGKMADGVIVGSALINRVEGANFDPQAGAKFIAELRTALEHDYQLPDRRKMGRGSTRKTRIKNFTIRGG